MPFVKIGDAASKTMGSVYGENIILFPQESGDTREIKIARSISSIEREIRTLRAICGVSGAARISVLILEELVEGYMAEVVASNQLSKKLSRLSKIFVEQKRDKLDTSLSQDQG